MQKEKQYKSANLEKLIWKFRPSARLHGMSFPTARPKTNKMTTLLHAASIAASHSLTPPKCTALPQRRTRGRGPLSISRKVVIATNSALIVFLVPILGHEGLPLP